ncbi:MAG TPA: hypothetical protein VGE91_08110 [Solirubrobacterales bacterium]|jgi:hypothetical protein
MECDSVNDERTLDDLLPPKPTAEELEWRLRVAKRRELLDHVDYLLRPPAQFYSDLEKAIELAAEERMEERIEIDRRQRSVAEIVDAWELEDLVERAREGRWGEAARDCW